MESNGNIRLSQHFTLQEMTRSATAERLMIKNVPTDMEIARLRVLCCNLLEPLRNAFGAPIVVTSGFRSKALNKAVGGANNSYHTMGMAADIAIAGRKTADKMAAYLLTLNETDQVIYETKGAAQWLHIGWSYHPRHEYLKILK